MNGKELIKLLQKQGWVLDRIQGSHHILVRGDQTLTVPVHGNSDLKKGTLHSIMKIGGIK